MDLGQSIGSQYLLDPVILDAPLEKFSESAREIATGRFDVTLPLVRSNDEIKDLYDSILQFLCVVMTEFLLMVSG